MIQIDSFLEVDVRDAKSVIWDGILNVVMELVTQVNS